MSTLKLSTLSNLAGSQSTAVENAINGSAKAWVNFNGTGTVAIRASFNVSSITDNGTGDYTVNFTTAMSDANYSAVSGAGDGAAAVGSGRFAFNYMQANPTSSAYRVITTNFAGSYHDPIYVSVGIFR